MQLAMKPLALALAAVLFVPSQAGRQGVDSTANPVRKVVTMLQAMQKKVEAEGAKEKELYEAFVCYCKKGNGDLAASIATGEAKAPSLASGITSAEAKLAQTKEALKEAQADRSSAKGAMAEATAIREKEAAAYAAEKAELDANIAAIAKAVEALEKGMAGSFLQTADAQRLRQLVLGKQDMLDVDRQELASFLSAKEGSGYAPKSGEITGILKQMGETLAKHLAESTATEGSALKSHEDLLAAKAKEVAALIESIEAKTVLIGELQVEIVQMKDDLSDTEAALVEDKKLLAGLKESCATKETEWEERSKTRSEELVALAETIKILNDDDALELFKKTLPSASASFVQMRVSAAASRARALATVHEARRAAGGPATVGLDLLALALTGKKALSQGGFQKVIKMCDDMVEVLKKEQEDDDHKKEYCEIQLDASDDKKKALERTVSDEENAIDQAKDGLAVVAEEIKALEASIKALDKSVAEATEQRKQENTEFKELMASDASAKELLSFAKNRLNKFYNPKLFKPAAKAELSAEGRIVANMGGVVLAQVSAHEQRGRAAAPPPETWTAYAKKSEENIGVIAMIDLLIKDLDKEMAEAQTEEKDAQADYEALMKDSVEKRTVDSKTLSDKLGAKAALEGELTAHEEAKTSSGKQLMATLKYIQSLRSECDWLLKYFEVRKEARAGEVESLKSAKAVLNGADFSFLQTKSRNYLRQSQ